MKLVEWRVFEEFVIFVEGVVFGGWVIVEVLLIDCMDCMWIFCGVFYVDYSGLVDLV